MNWYYAVGGQQTGPVDDAQFAALVQAGTIQSDTLVWNEGLPNWQPYSYVQPAAAPSPPPDPTLPPQTPLAANEVVCAECGGIFTKENTIQYGNAWVCASCKPLFVQKLREGAPLAPAASGVWLNEQQLLEREYRIDLGECLSRSWKIFSDNAGLVIGATVLVGLVGLGFFMVSTLAGMVIPMANSIMGCLYTGPLGGGLLWFFLRLARGESATIGDAFEGFRKRGGQLLLASLVQGLLNIACLLPLLAAAGVLGFTLASRRGATLPNMAGGMIAIMALLFLVSVSAVAYLSTLWTHSLLLIVDKGYKFWPAMQLSRKVVNKGWWMTFLFLLVGGIISGAGALACGFGLLVSMPVYFGMRAYFYQDNFRDLAPAS